MQCTSCETEVGAQAQFCGNCGKPVRAKAQGAAGPKPVLQAQAAAVKLLADIRSLKFSVLFPIESWVAERPWTIGWVQALAFLAFYPVALGLIYQNHHSEDLTDQLKTSAWALGFYFAAIWGAILYRTIKPARVEPQILITTFFFTAIIGIGVDLTVQVLPGFSQLYSATHSADVEWQLLGYVCGVGVLEESVKALPLYFWFLIQKKPTTPREAAFIGVLSGLAFGVAEAVSYSIGYANDRESGRLTPGAFLIHQFVRMISLPLLHALWSGVVGYFIGLAANFPRKQAALLTVGIASMALIHGLYDTFSDTWFAFALCVLSLLLFVMYMRSAEKITEGLESRPRPQ
jgi:RsiW-degrading membrane proteinase PrsW (M82 family)